MKNFFDKLKKWCNSAFDGLKRALNNFKLWLVKNIDFIKKCVITAFIGLLCLAVLPFSCKTSNNTAHAEQVDNDVSFCFLDYLGNTNFALTGSLNGANNLPITIDFSPSFEINSLSEVYIVAVNTRTRIDIATLGGESVNLPQVFRHSIYNSPQSDYMQLVVVDCICNLTVSDLSRSSLVFSVSIDSGVTGLTTFNFVEPVSGNHLLFSIQVYAEGDNLLTPTTNRDYTIYDVLVYSIADVQGAYDNGYIDGYDIGYTAGYDGGYGIGYTDGFGDGAEQGYQNAINDGESGGVFAGIINAVNSFLDMQLIGNVTIANVIQIGFGIILLGFIIKIFLGG